MGLLDKLAKLKAFCDRYRNVQTQHALLPEARARHVENLKTAEREKAYWSARVDELNAKITENDERSIKMDTWLTDNHANFVAYEVAASEEIQQYATKLAASVEELPDDHSDA